MWIYVGCELRTTTISFLDRVDDGVSLVRSIGRMS